MTRYQEKVRIICQLLWSLFGIGLGIYGFLKNDIRVLVVGCFITQSAGTDASIDNLERHLKGRVGL